MLLIWTSGLASKDFNKICNIVLFWCKAKSPSFVTVVTITAKPVLSGNPLGMAYWPLNTGWLFNPGLTNVRVIMENEGSQRIKYLPVSHDKLTITFSTSSWNKRKKLRPLDAIHSYALLWYIFSKWPFNTHLSRSGCFVSGDWKSFVSAQQWLPLDKGL